MLVVCSQRIRATPSHARIVELTPMRLHRLFILLWLGFLCISQARGQETKDAAGSSLSQNENLRDLTTQILKDASGVGCFAQACKMLVVDFGMPNGVNPAYGSVLADEFSRQLADSQKDVQVFNRGLLKTFATLTKPSSTLPRSDKEAREFACGLGANAVVTGSATKLPDNTLKLSIRLLNARDVSSVSRTEEALVPPPPASLPQESLRPNASYSAANPKNLPTGNGKFAVPGKDGVLSPTCYFMPNPPYTHEAKEAKFSGVVPVEAVVGLDGRVTNIHILKPMGLGLDDTIFRTMQTWKCKPGNAPNGKPVATLVMFELHFKLY
jgi:TonB family protein